MLFNGKQPDEPGYEFSSAMPDEEYDYDDEGYEDDGEYDEDDDYAEEGGKPKGNMVKTALMGIAAVIALGGGAYYAANTFAPDTVNDLVNNLPFISHEASPSPVPSAMVGHHHGPRPAQTASGTATAGGEVAPAPNDVTASADTAAVPPVPAKGGTDMKRRTGKPAQQQAAKEASGEAAPAKPAPAKVASKPASAAPKAEEHAPPMAKPAPTAHKPAPTSRWAATHRAAGSAAGRYGRARYARAYAGTHSVLMRRWVRRHGRWVRSYYYAMVANRPVMARYYGRGRHYSRYARYSRYAALPIAHGRGGYAVQVGSFSDSANASELAAKLRGQGLSAYVGGAGAAGSSGGYLVRSVPVSSSANARKLARQYRRAGYAAQVVPTGNGKLAVAVGAYGSRASAEAIVSSLNRRGLYGTVSEGSLPHRSHGGLAHVYVGHFPSRQAAAAKMRQLQKAGIPAAVSSM